MADRSFPTDFEILLGDDSRTRLELFDDWLPGIETRFARDARALVGEVDSTVAVACLARELLGEEEARCRRAVLRRNPHCQLVVIVGRQSLTGPLEDEYDACLRRPVVRADLQSTLERRYKCGAYSALLQEFYRVNAELATRDAADESPSEDSSDREIAARLRRIRERLDALQAVMDGEDVRSVLRSIRSRNRVLKRPDRDAPAASDSKYHPDRCPKCKLPWGVDHRNDLGDGYERVGADVWKCARCDELVQGVGASHRRVTW